MITDSRSGERLRAAHTTSARRPPAANWSRPRSRRLLTTRPRASLLSTDSRYLVARPVAFVNEMVGLGIANGFLSAKLNGATKIPIDVFYFFPLSSLISAYDGVPQCLICDGQWEEGWRDRYLFENEKQRRILKKFHTESFGMNKVVSK